MMPRLEKGKQHVVQGRRTSGGDASAGIVCYKCGKAGHKSNVCRSGARVKENEVRCFQCGEVGHMSRDCKHRVVVCFNCGEGGHISSQCGKPKKTPDAGKVFALSGAPTANEDGLVRGTSFINGFPLVTIIDTGATHSFIAADCVKRLDLTLSSLNREMIVEVPAKGTVTTSFVCSDCPLSIFGRDFRVNLVCLPLVGMDIVLGMDWLKTNYVHINCYNNSVMFSSLEEEEQSTLVTTCRSFGFSSSVQTRKWRGNRVASNVYLSQVREREHCINLG